MEQSNKFKTALYDLTNTVNYITTRLSDKLVYPEPYIYSILTELMNIAVIDSNLSIPTGKLVNILRSAGFEPPDEVKELIDLLCTRLRNDLSGGLDTNNRANTFYINRVFTSGDTKYHAVVTSVEASNKDYRSALLDIHKEDVRAAMKRYMDITLEDDPAEAFRDIYPEVR